MLCLQLWHWEVSSFMQGIYSEAIVKKGVVRVILSSCFGIGTSWVSFILYYLCNSGTVWYVELQYKQFWVLASLMGHYLDLYLLKKKFWV